MWFKFAECHRYDGVNSRKLLVIKKSTEQVILFWMCFVLRVITCYEAVYCVGVGWVCLWFHTFRVSCAVDCKEPINHVFPAVLLSMTMPSLHSSACFLEYCWYNHRKRNVINYLARNIYFSKSLPIFCNDWKLEGRGVNLSSVSTFLLVGDHLRMKNFMVLDKERQVSYVGHMWGFSMAWKTWVALLCNTTIMNDH